MRKNPNLKCEIADTLSWDFLLYSCLITENQSRKEKLSDYEIKCWNTKNLDVKKKQLSNMILA